MTEELSYYENLIYQYTGVIDKDTAKKIEDVCIQCSDAGRCINPADIIDAMYQPSGDEYQKLTEEINKQPVININKLQKRKDDNELKLSKKLRNGWR